MIKAKRKKTNVAASIEAGEVLTLTEFRRRFNWGTDQLMTAKRLGLPLAQVGATKYIAGSAFHDWIRRLGEDQAGG